MDQPDKYVVTVTRRGVIKRTELPAYANIRSGGIIALLLDEGDQLISVHLVGDNDHIFIATRDGMAIDNFLVQDPLGRPFDEPSQLARIERSIEDALANKQKLQPRLEARPLPRTRAEAFAIAPNVLIDNKASNRFTVIEIHARDKPALLFNLAYALFQSKVTVHSAHITTYGERAVDTFYITDLLGGKIESKTRLQTLERRLLDAAEATVMEQIAA